MGLVNCASATYHKLSSTLFISSVPCSFSSPSTAISISTMHISRLFAPGPPPSPYPYDTYTHSGANSVCGPVSRSTSNATTFYLPAYPGAAHAPNNNNAHCDPPVGHAYGLDYSSCAIANRDFERRRLRNMERRKKVGTVLIVLVLLAGGLVWAYLYRCGQLERERVEEAEGRDAGHEGEVFWSGGR